MEKQKGLAEDTSLEAWKKRHKEKSPFFVGSAGEVSPLPFNLPSTPSVEGEKEKKDE